MGLSFLQADQGADVGEDKEAQAKQLNKRYCHMVEHFACKLLQVLLADTWHIVKGYVALKVHILKEYGRERVDSGYDVKEYEGGKEEEA